MVIKKQLKKEISEVKKFLELNSILKIVSILFILSITVLAIVNISRDKENNANTQNAITVSGHGEIKIKPDTTKFTISVTGKDMKSSQDAAKTKMNNAISILKQNGVLDKNIKNINYNTYPKYSSRTSACTPVVSIKNSTISNTLDATQSQTATSKSKIAKPSAVSGSVGNGLLGAPTIISSGVSSGLTPSNCIDRTSQVVGYETNQSIEVRITDINKNPELAGVLIETVGSIGVQTSDLTSFIDNVDLSKQYARDQAIFKAKTQAQDIADSLGINLGKITFFSENSGGGYPYPMMMNAKMVGAADSAPINLPVGETTVTSDVNITYSIR
jgi:uncharacterized protein YggE